MKPAFRKLLATASAALLAASLAPLAQAQTASPGACQSLSGFVESVSLVRQIQTDPGGPETAARFDRLSDIAGTLSLPALIPADPSATRAGERAALIAYVSGLREATNARQSGHARYAEQALGTLVSPDLFAGLSSLESLWECREPDGRTAGTLQDSQTRASEPAFRGEGGADEAARSPSPSNPATAPAASRNRATASGASEGRGAYFGRGAVVTPNMAALLSGLIVLLLVGLFLWVQKRNRRQTAREARRVIDQPVMVAFAGQFRRMHIVDISMQGFKIRHDGALPEEGELTVQLGGEMHTGHIRWSNANFAGVKFRRALLPERLAAILGTDARPVAA